MHHNEPLPPQLVAVDRHELIGIDDDIQVITMNIQHLAFALGAVETVDPVADGIVSAVKNALSHNAEITTGLSECMHTLIQAQRIEVSQNKGLKI